MCLVSRTFRDIAQPLLFHSFDDDNLLHGDLRRTISFAKAIYRRPELGQYVQVIEFMHLPIGPKPKILPADDAKLCKLAIQALELGDQKKQWISLMRTYDMSVIIALVVVKLLNLRAFTLGGDLDLGTRFKPLFDRDPSFLSQLRDLYIRGAPTGYNLATYEDWFTRPSLRNVTLEYCDLENASFPSTWTPRSLAVDTLFMRHSRVDSGAIYKLMQACKELTMFAYQNFDPQSAETRPGTPAIATHFTPAEALEAARLHKNTLDHFHVELARSPSVLNDIQRYLSSRTKFGSFREFTALETMMVPHAYLPVHPELPRSLKEIEITDCNSSIQNMAQNIAKDARKGLYPELRDVRVLTMDVREPIKLPGGRIPPGKTPEACFLGLRELFKGTKVDFNISPYVLEPYGDDEDYDDEFQLPGLGAGGPPGGNGMPPALLDLLMEQAMRDPDFAHLRPPGR